MERNGSMTRLETLSPYLKDRLQRASAAQQRTASLTACEFAIRRAEVQHPLVEQALVKIRAGSILTSKEKADLDSLVEQLDEEYFALQEAAAEGRASSDAYLRPFGQARAVSALSFAGEEDAFRAASEAIYEASATTDDADELVALVQSVLNNQGKDIE